ncbi:FAD-binding oxidoreductase [Streptomyces roseicoloratus]|uniref:FAD-binding oxidoreductase n=1 Tax=Streptomyces roseicoloratus TaxID=2508722 RepID=A0ABY9RZE0_9ACTN|nr:FAD-binding oxidoreductase [Streptomyces roseicoloratus]WMX47078.1 FAD-binding oxidoreductase [Streptomyces roseicoloratus]
MSGSMPGQSADAFDVTGFQTAFPVRPDRVVAATGPDDVRAAVRHAAEHGLTVAVQSTGHGRGGPVEGGLLLDTRRMDEVVVDPVARTARIGAGARWGQVVAAAAPHGLAPLNGSSPGVGVVGYLLGGGLGILGRTYGWAADHVRSLDLVTADGEPRHLTPGDAAFEALLGGGHGLGVVTAVETALVPVARLYGGSLAFDGAVVDPARVLRGYTEWAAGLPGTLTSSLAALVHPDVPALPPHLRGRYVLSVRVAFTGDAAEGERLAAPLRALGPALSDSLRELPYTESHTIHADPDFPHAYWGDGILLDAMDEEALAEVLRLTGPRADRMAVVQLNHLGGALAAEPAVPNSVPYREAGWLVRALYPLDESGTAPVRELHARVERALAPRTLGRAAGFVFGDRERTDGLYDPATAKRLAAVKSELDPASLFGAFGKR